MRFIMMVKATGYTEAGVKYNQQYGDALKAYKKSLSRAGVLLAAEELQPSASGIRIQYPLHGGEPQVMAGPFTVNQELIASYTLIDVQSEEEAADWALKMPVPAGFGAFAIELRKLEEESEPKGDPRTLAMEAELEDQISMFKK